MHQPSLEVFTGLAARADLIPVHREIIADLDTPLTIFNKLAGEQSHAFLFESLEGGEKWGRYSFVGYDPLLVFESKGDLATVTRGGKVSVLQGNPLDLLREILATCRVSDQSEYLPRFYGGAVGFLGYDMVRFLERLPEANPPLAGFPDSSFMIPRTVLIYDNLKQLLTVVDCVQVDRGRPLVEQFSEAISRIDRVVERLRQYVHPAALEPSSRGQAHDFTPNMSEASFREMVARAKEYILAGDIIQVVLSQRFHTETDLHPFQL